MINQLKECTIFASKLDGNIFLFKNGDNHDLMDHEIIHMIKNDVEVAFYSNQNGFAEGMNEFGIGLVYSFLTENNHANYKIKPVKKNPYPDTVDINPENLSDKGEFMVEILTSKTLDEAFKKVSESEFNGNYIIATKDDGYLFEVYKGDVRYERLTFKNDDIYLRTNHGLLIPNAGHKKDFYNWRRPDSEIRYSNAKRYILGFKDFKDVMKRMGFQEYDSQSANNSFRTDSLEKTTGQYLFDLNDLVFNFVFYDKNAKFYGIIDKTPKEYKTKIKINIIDKNEFKENEHKKFLDKIDFKKILDNEVYY